MELAPEFNGEVANQGTRVLGRPVSRVVRSRPLKDDEIRLVDFGAQAEEPILIVAHIEELPEYMAISYCWGEENCLHQFEINNQVLIVNSSLLAVLQGLKGRSFTGKIWADALCIDQSNALEKAVQIPLMGSIFSKASMVFAWLGETSPDNALTSEFMKHLSNLFTAEELEEQRKKIGTKQGFEQAVERLSLPSSESRIWVDLMEMLHVPWFERVWMIQEAIVAENLVMGYGRISFSWNTLFWAQLHLHAIDFEDRDWQCKFRKVNFSVINRIYNIESNWTSYRRQTLRMDVLLLEARYRESSHGQDKIYAMYNLMTPEVQARLPVDLSASVQRTFIRATKAVLSLDPNGLYLLASGPGRSDCLKLSGLPSWVPDYTTIPCTLQLTYFWGFDAGRGRGRRVLADPQVSFVDGEDTLGLKGFSLGIVEYARSVRLESEPPPGVPDTRYQKALPYVQDCLSALREATGRSDDELMQPFSKALVCGRPGSWTGWQYDRCSDGMSEDLRNNMRRWQGMQTDEDVDEAKAERYRRRLYGLAKDCCFFITKSGHFGVGVHDLSVGDQIVIVCGSETPFVTRKRPYGSLYQFIGECYVDGVMDGEAFDAYAESGKEYQTFTFD